MPAISWKSFAFVSALALTVPAGALGASAAIEWSKIGLAYDGLFVDANKRVQDVLAEYKALAASATEQQKDAVRKKFCAVGGELVGYYKFVQAMANDCAKQGEKMDQLLDVINKQLGLAQQGVKQPCG